MAENISQKKTLINKANRSMFVMIAVASALLVFSLVASKGLYTQASHRNRVIKEKKLASNTLASNDVEVGKLIESFKTFDSANKSLIGTDDKNSKIVLDSLPPKYDFPALATSLEKILTEGGYSITSISGIDNEIIEVDDDTSDPQPIEIPFSISVSGPYDKVKNLPIDLERSIRPMYVLSLSLSGSVTDTRLTISAKTYYQPGKNLDVRYKEVR